MNPAALPDDCLLSILNFVQNSEHRNTFSLVSHACWDLEASSRKRLRISSSVPNAALGPLLARFSSLTSLDINYLGWKPTSGPQIGDEALQMIPILCPSLEILSLSFCGFVTDLGLASLFTCQNLRSLNLNFLPRITSAGLLSLAQGCPSLESLHVERCLRVDGARWLEALGSRSSRKSMTSALRVPFDDTTPLRPCSPLASPVSDLSHSTASTPDSSFSPLLMPLGSPLTPPPLDLPPASPFAPSPFCLETSLHQHHNSSPQRAVGKLTVLKCPRVGEQDVARLGKEGWENLQELRFEAVEEASTSTHVSSGEDESDGPAPCAFEDLAPEMDLRKLKVLSLKNCPNVHKEGLGLILSRLSTLKKQDKENRREEPWGLEELHLVNCPGLNDSDMKQLLGSFSSSLRVLSLSLMKWLVSTQVPQLPQVTPARTTTSQEAALVPATAQQTSSCSATNQQAPHMQQSDRAVTTGSLEHIAQVPGLRHLELACKDEFASSAKLFEGFADSAISSLVAKLPVLQTLSVGKGLHVTANTFRDLRRRHRGVDMREA